ncbi:MAG: helix-turn-helix transcriptional regulator [Deltaproteobacteria bacterium]|nr:helix-turn-helix transcriptional regulator [Deltaproteobacteria bacterium]
MAKIKSAVEILKRDFAKDPELEKLYEEEKINFSIALIIRQSREAEGITQAELAERVGTTQSVISRLEDSDYEGHSLTMLDKIARALHRRLSIEMESEDHHRSRFLESDGNPSHL